jgi:hypothetical protein
METSSTTHILVRTLFTIGIIGGGIVTGACIVAFTNAVSAWLSPISFYIFLAKTDVIGRPVWDSIMIGLFKGGMYGGLAGMVFGVVGRPVMTSLCAFRVARRSFLLLLISLIGCWLLGGVCAVSVSFFSSSWLRATTPTGIPQEIGPLLGYAYGVGATWGRIVGGIAAVLAGGGWFVPKWKTC